MAAPPRLPYGIPTSSRTEWLVMRNFHSNPAIGEGEGRNPRQFLRYYDPRLKISSQHRFRHVIDLDASCCTRPRPLNQAHAH